MELKMPYLQAFSRADPKEFNALVRSGRMDAHLLEVWTQANQYLQEMLAKGPKDDRGEPTMQSRREAEEVVVAMMTEFPTPLRDQRPEMTDEPA